MTEADTLELAALRERAYGPDADISADATALSRLRELEALAGGPVTVTAPTARPDPSPEAAEPDPMRPTAAPVPSPLPDADSTGHRVRPRRALLPLAWIASVVATAVIVAAVTAGIVAPGRAGDLVLRPIAHPNASADLLPGAVGEDVRYFEQVAGIHVASVRQSDSVCIVVWSRANTTVAGGCAPTPLYPTLDLPIRAVVPDDQGPVTQAAVNRFGTGSTLRLTLQGDTVTVDVAAPSN